MKRGVLLLLILLDTFTSYSSNNVPWNLEPVVVKNNFNKNTIYDIYCGSTGFVWLCTDQGLTRYDGFRFRDYPLIYSFDPHSIPLPQTVTKLSESPDGLFYAQLYQGGVVAFDKSKERFLYLSFDQEFNLRDVSDFCWINGTLYLATSRGLYEAGTAYQNNADSVSCMLNREPLYKGKITKLCAGDKGSLYLCVEGKKIIEYSLITKKTYLIKEYKTRTIDRLFLNNNYLWICSQGSDLVCYDLKKRAESTISMEVAGNERGHLNFYITGLACRDSKNYYLSTWGGVLKLSFDSEDICESPYTLTYLTSYKDTFHANIESRVVSVFWDARHSILWAGTLGGGMVKFVGNNNMYARLRQYFNSGVTGIVEDDRGYIWLSMADGTIMKSTTPDFSSETCFEQWRKTPSLSEYHHIYKDKKGHIWLGNSKGEVLHIRPETEEVRTFRLHLNGEEDFSPAISQFCMDSRNRLWVATTDGLLLVDPETFACKKVEPVNERIESINAVAEDKEGNMWIGTNRGLKRLEYIGSRPMLVGQYEKENALEERIVQAIYVNNYNQVYASYQNIVVRIDGKNTEKLEAVYVLQNGLTSGNFTCMVDDQRGNTWAGNNAGIMMIRNGQKSFYDYWSIGGCNAVCRLKAGSLVWANSYGLLYFNPALIAIDSTENRLLLTDLKVNGKIILAGQRQSGRVLLASSPDKQTSLTFNSNDQDFSLYFSDLCYSMMQQQIAYRLQPKEEEWKIQSLSEAVAYDGLSAGKYVLEVRQVFPDMQEGEITRIPIVIANKWYATVWAYICYALILVLMSYLLYRKSVKRTIRRQAHRRRELMLRDKLCMEQKKNEQSREVELIRNRLLMLFVQELRTPLSLIIGPLKDLLKEQTLDSSLVCRTQVAYRNSLRMLNACNQLWAISHQGNLRGCLEVAPYSVEKLINCRLLDIRELVKEYPIDFHYEKQFDKDLEFYVDKKQVDFIIHNLLINAFTHIHYAGKVSLTVCEVSYNRVRYVSIIVEDDGKNFVRTEEQIIDEEGMPGNESSSMQLGFGIMQRVVERHHGTIELQSSQNTGTKVTVNFPLSRTMLEGDANIRFIIPEELAEVSPDIDKMNDTKHTTGIARPLSTDTYKEKAVNEPDRAKKTLLIVEDHKDVRLYLKMLFGKEYNLLMATNGQEGVDIATKELPDLILCDVMMPVKDGFECCREIKEGLETCSIPFIMLTAKGEEEDVIRGLQLGVDDYVLKPFAPGILKAKVVSLINGRQNLKQMYTKLFMMSGADLPFAGESEQPEEKVEVEDPFINSVIKIVEENMGEADFCVKKLAEKMNMSQPTLYRKVKQSTDYTIIELIRGVRMRRAAVLLKTKKYSVQEVVEMVGYNDVPTFRKHFVDAFGTTPSNYE